MMQQVFHVNNSSLLTQNDRFLHKM